MRADAGHALQQPYAAAVLGQTIVDALLETNAGAYLPHIDRHGRIRRPKGVERHSGRVALLPLMNQAEVAEHDLMVAALTDFDTLQPISASQKGFMPLADLMDYPDIAAVQQEYTRRRQNPHARTHPKPHGADFRAATAQLVLRNLASAQAVAIVANQMTSPAINACLLGHELMHVQDGRTHPLYHGNPNLSEESEHRAMYTGVALYRAAGGTYELSATADVELLDNAARHYVNLDQANPFGSLAS